MTRRNPPAKWVLPDVIDPPGRVCYQIEVPDNLYHKAAFFGALLDLAAAYKWADDLDHTAKDVALVWRDIIDNLQLCPPAPTVPGWGLTLEDALSTQIRISPDDSCIIQMWCIDHWEDWYDPRNCVIGGVGQPAPGGDIPVQECRSETYTLSGRDQFLVPFPVDDGYTIQIEDASGGWWDGDSGHAWQCPSGYTYALGACVSSGPANASGPIPTLPYGRLIAQVGSAYVDAYNTTITVPTGTGPTNVYIQMNDDALGDNSGSVTFQLTVCNAETILDLVVVPIDLDTPTAAGFSSAVGVLYKLSISGVGNSNGVADGADFYYTFANGSWQYVSQHVTVDGADVPPIPSFNSGHTYTAYIMGTGAPFEFLYYDDNYTDNSGTIEVQIEVA